MGVIRLKNMQFFAYHGVYDFEKELGAPFEEGGMTYFFKNDGLQNQYVIKLFVQFAYIWFMDI